MFLLDDQIDELALSSLPDDIVIADDKEDRSFVFLLYPPGVDTSDNPEHFIVRVPFRSLVVGLLSHQVLLQIIGTLLLQGSNHIVPR